MEVVAVKRLIVLFFGVLFLLNFVSAFDVYVEENDGKITNFYGEYFVARVNGTVTITNPSDADFFNVAIPLYLSTYTIRSPNNTALSSIDENGIFIQRLNANSSVSLDYEMGGISTEDFTDGGKAMLETAITAFDLKVYSQVMGSILKAPFEDSAITGRNKTRLISVHLTNPTGFELTVDLVNVIKTSDLDPSVQLDSWDLSSQISSLTAYQSFEMDFFDENASEGEVYWLQTDMYLSQIDVFRNRSIDFFDQDDLFIPITNETNITYNETSTDFLDKRVFLRKLIDSSLALPGQPMNVTIIVNNFGSTSLQGILSDVLPFGFELVKIYTEGARVQGTDVEWTIDLRPRTAQRFVYEIRFTDTESVGVDYFDPATLLYDDEFVYSQSVPFVRQYVAQKKVYMQKSLDFRPNGDVQVDITVRNLGETSLSKLIVKEFLGPGDEFKEITQPFREKGVWEIDTLTAGEIWQTSYVTDKSNVLNSFPELFGVPRSGLFRNIILKNVVESKFKVLETSVVEIAGLSLLALVIVAYIVPHSVFLSIKRRYLRDLRATGKEIQFLKESSAKKDDFHSLKPAESISSSSIQQNAPSPKSEFLQQREEKIKHTQAIIDQIKNKLNEGKD